MFQMPYIRCFVLKAFETALKRCGMDCSDYSVTKLHYIEAKVVPCLLFLSFFCPFHLQAGDVERGTVVDLFSNFCQNETGQLYEDSMGCGCPF